jgi:hypothetical protein
LHKNFKKCPFEIFSKPQKTKNQKNRGSERSDNENEAQRSKMKS